MTILRPYAYTYRVCQPFILTGESLNDTFLSEALRVIPDGSHPLEGLMYLCTYYVKGDKSFNHLMNYDKLLENKKHTVFIKI